MFHFFETITNTRGDSLVGYQVALRLPGTATAVPIYADQNATPIIAVSGLANVAVTDAAGNADLFVAFGEYDVIISSATGAVLKQISRVPMNGGSQGLPGKDGDPGGNVESVGPAESLSVLTYISAGTTSFYTSGPSRGRWIEDTSMTDADAAAHPRGIKKLGDRYFRRDTEALTVRQFGAIGITGLTDDFPGIDAALRYSRRFGVNPDGATFLACPAVRFPDGRYFSSQTIVLKGGTVPILGSGQGKNAPTNCLIIVPKDTNGFIVERHDTSGVSGGSVSPITYGADGTVIEGIAVVSQGGDATGVGSAHGFVVRARSEIRKCQALRFPGCGLFSIVSAGTADFQGNANCLTIADNLFNYNGFAGIYISGQDVNAGRIAGNDCSFNGRYGILSNAFLGNLIEANHAEGNGLGGIGYNPAGMSSVVRYSDPAYLSSTGRYKRWYVVYGQDALASTTTPGTNPAVWAPYPAGDVAAADNGPAFHPIWYSGMPAITGAPHAVINGNDTMALTGNYAEGSQAPAIIGGRCVSVGNFFGEVGVVSTSGGRPFNLTNALNALSNPGGFYTGSNDSAVQVSLNMGAYLQQFVTPEMPNGAQWRRQGEDLIFSYAGGAAIIRILGAASTNRIGPLVATFERIGIGSGANTVMRSARTVKPATGEFPPNTYVENANAVAGQPRGWKYLANGAIVDDAVW